MLNTRQFHFYCCLNFNSLMTDAATLSILFGAVATIVATLTGLTGAFATFRLQRMDAKLDFLKDYILHKEVPGCKTLNEKLRETGYRHIEKIYLHNLDAVSLLEDLVKDLNYHGHSPEYFHDIKNIEKHQRHYDKIKKITSRDFFLSLSFVFVSLGLLLAADVISGFSLQWIILLLFFFITALVFYAFLTQFKMLLE
jgi:hypothetical protein